MNKGVVISVIVVIIVLAGGFFLLNSNQSQTPDPLTTQEPQDFQTSTTGETITEDQSSTDSSQTAGEVKEFTVTGSNFKFEPATMTVNEGDTVRITFKNGGGFPHDFVIDEFDVKSNQITAGNEEVVEFVADKVGTYEYYCSVGNHRAQGMKGTLTVN